jgi:hypothetical protein
LPLRAVCRLPAGKHEGILTHLQTKIKKKRLKKHFFCTQPAQMIGVFGSKILVIS